MPQLLRYQQQTTVAKSPTLSGSELDAGRSQTFAEIGQGLTATGLAVGDALAYRNAVDARLKDAEETSKANWAAVEYESGLAALTDSVATQPDHTTMRQSFDEGQKKLLSQIATDYPLTGRHAEDFNLRAFQLTNDHALKVSSAYRARQIDVSKGRLADSRSKILGLLETETDPQRQKFLRDMWIDSAEQMRDVGLVGHEETATDIAAFRTKADEVVSKAQFDNRAATLTADIMAAGGTKEQSVAAAARITDTDLSKEVARRVGVLSDERKAAELAGRKARREAIWDQIYAGAGLEAIPQDLPQKDEGPMRQWVQKRAEAAAKGKAFDPVTDPKTFTDLWDLRAKDPKGFQALNLPEYRLQLSTTHFNQLSEEQRRLTSGGSATSSPGGLSALEVVKKVAGEAGVTGKTWEASYELRAHDAIVAAQAQHPDKPLTFEEKRAAAVRVLPEMTATDAGLFSFDKAKPLGLWTAEDRAKTIAEPPADVERKAIAELARRGITSPTEDQVREIIADALDAAGVPRGE